MQKALRESYLPTAGNADTALGMDKGDRRPLDPEQIKRQLLNALSREGNVSASEEYQTSQLAIIWANRIMSIQKA